jgi:hypothetical protein
MNLCSLYFINKIEKMNSFSGNETKLIQEKCVHDHNSSYFSAFNKPPR